MVNGISRRINMPNWLWKPLDKLFDWMDKKLHDITYIELDEENSFLRNRVEELEEQLEYADIKNSSHW